MKKESSIAKTVLVGAGIAALAGYYFLSDSRQAKARRRKVQGWMLRFRADVMDKLEDAKDMSAEAYAKAVDAVSERYAAMKDVDGKELGDLAKELKSHWKSIKGELSEAGEALKKAGKTVAKSATKAAKK